jgi:hypothetical protein
MLQMTAPLSVQPAAGGEGRDGVAGTQEAVVATCCLQITRLTRLL